MRILKRIRKISGWLGLLAIGAVTAALIVGSVTGQWRVVTVLSGSMEPFMPVGGIVVQTPLPVADVQPGDVITYRIPEADHRIVTHRVVEVHRDNGETMVITKGDANPANDPWKAVLVGDTSWKTEHAVPGVGYALQAAKGGGIRLVLMGLAPLLLAVLWLRDLWRPKATAEPDADPAEVEADDDHRPGSGRRATGGLPAADELVVAQVAWSDSSSLPVSSSSS